MSTLYPLYYNPDSKIYSTGWPESSRSAMFTGYVHWAMMPIYKNSNNFAIRITNVATYFGVNTSAKARLYYAILNDNILESTTFTVCSDEFNVPKTTDLSEAYNVEPKDLIIPPNCYFALGFKAVRTSSTGRLSIARSNTVNKNKYRPFYNGQFMNNSLPDLVDVDRVPKSDYWSFQIPRIVLTYEPNSITPIVSNTNVTMTQGENVAINISGYNDWSYSWVDDVAGVELSRNGNILTISSGIADFTGSISGLLEINGLNSKVQVKITVFEPKQPNIYISNANSLRPMESTTISCDMPDAYYHRNDSNFIYTLIKETDSSESKPILEEIKNSNASYTFRLNKLTEYVYNNRELIDDNIVRSWLDGNDVDDVVYVYFSHPLNSRIVSETAKINVTHYNSNVINVKLSANTTFGTTDENNPYYVYCEDITPIVGGAQLFGGTNYENNALIEDNNKIKIISNNDVYVHFGARLTNDWPIKIDELGSSLHITETIEFSFNNVDNNSTSWYGIGSLHLNENNDIDDIRINPICYPLKITFPSDIDTSSNITITDINFKFNSIVDKYNYNLLGESSTVNYPNIDNLFDIIDSNANILPGSTHLICNVGGETGLPLDMSQLVHVDTIIGEVQATVNYRLKSSSNLVSKLFSKEFVAKVNIFKPFSINFSQGDIFELNSDSVESIDELAHMVNSLNEIYSLGLNNIDEFITKSIGLEISNYKDKQSVENSLQALNSFVNAINRDSKLRHIKPAREKIAIGEYIMWDDSVNILADGSQNKFKFKSNYSTHTASPWKELYNLISRINFSEKHYIKFGGSAVVYADAPENYKNLTISM